MKMYHLKKKKITRQTKDMKEFEKSEEIDKNWWKNLRGV